MKPFSLRNIIRFAQGNTFVVLSALAIILNFEFGSCENLKKAVPLTDENPNTLKGSIQKSANNPSKLKSGILDKFKNKTLNSKVSDEMLKNSASKTVGVIGVLFKLQAGQLPEIIHVYPNTPAYKAGIKVGDYIVAVDGVPVMGLEREDIYGSIVGVPDTPVSLSIRRGNSFFAKKMLRMDVTEIPDYSTRTKYMREL